MRVRASREGVEPMSNDRERWEMAWAAARSGDMKRPEPDVAEPADELSKCDPLLP